MPITNFVSFDPAYALAMEPLFIEPAGTSGQRSLERVWSGGLENLELVSTRSVGTKARGIFLPDLS